MIWLLLAGFAATCVWLFACARLRVLHEWHHYYIGLFFYAMPWWPMVLTGVVIMVDDAMQHAVQLHRAGYRSPLHRLAHHVGLI